MSIWSVVRKQRWRAAALAAALLALPAVAGAKEQSRAELEDRIRRLERIIQERGLDKPQPPAATPSKAEPIAPLDKSEVAQIVDDKLKSQKPLAGWQDGFYLQSPSGDFKLKLRGYAQADLRFFPVEEGDTGTEQFYLRRVRPIFEGTVYKYFDFRIMPDFAGNSTVLQDAYMDVNYIPWLKFRAGKFKPPVSLERLQSGSELLFIERSIANQLAPSRDVGVQFFGDVAGGVLGYQIGAFNGTVDGGTNETDTTADKEMAARVFVEPFRNTAIKSAKGLGFGVGSSFGGQKNGDNLNGINYRTSGRSSFFRYTTSSSISVVADGDRARIDPQAYWFYGPFGLEGEYIISKQDLKRTDSSGTTSGSMDNRGWFTQASWVLTGENASFKMVNPINPFDPRQGRWGAFEIAARGSGLDIDDDAFDGGFASEPTSTGGAIAWGLGVNWYLNKSFKLQANYERTEFDTEVEFGDELRDHEDVFLTRFQISF